MYGIGLPIFSPNKSDRFRVENCGLFGAISQFIHFQSYSQKVAWNIYRRRESFIYILNKINNKFDSLIQSKLVLRGLIN